MLSEYQTAILEEMGIVTFVESTKVTKHESQQVSVKSNKIQSLRESLGTQSSSSNADQIKKESLPEPPFCEGKISENKESEVNKVTVSIENADLQIIKDIIAAFEPTNISLPKPTQWTVDTAESSRFSSDFVKLPTQPNQLNASQKKALWTSIINVLSNSD